MSMALDFNRSNLSDRPINTLINDLIERAEPASELSDVSRRQQHQQRMPAQGAT
jgi:hypothetical protein